MDLGDRRHREVGGHHHVTASQVTVYVMGHPLVADPDQCGDAVLVLLEHERQGVRTDLGPVEVGVCVMWDALAGVKSTLDALIERPRGLQAMPHAFECT